MSYTKLSRFVLQLLLLECWILKSYWRCRIHQVRPVGTVKQSACVCEATSHEDELEVQHAGPAPAPDSIAVRILISFDSQLLLAHQYHGKEATNSMKWRVWMFQIRPQAKTYQMKSQAAYLLLDMNCSAMLTPTKLFRLTQQCNCFLHMEFFIPFRHHFLTWGPYKWP